jgi:hypothetical protein
MMFHLLPMDKRAKNWYYLVSDAIQITKRGVAEIHFDGVDQKILKRPIKFDFVDIQYAAHE